MHLWSCISSSSKALSCAVFFSFNSYGCLYLPMKFFFLSLKSDSKVKISKNLELSRLPKIKKISLSRVGVFHISTKTYSFSHGKIQLEESPTTLWSWISQILTFYGAFRKVCMCWSLSQMGWFLVKCRLRVKSLNLRTNFNVFYIASSLSKVSIGG
jgi:hypothetical protein